MAWWGECSEERPVTAICKNIDAKCVNIIVTFFSLFFKNIFFKISKSLMKSVQAMSIGGMKPLEQRFVGNFIMAEADL